MAIHGKKRILRQKIIEYLGLKETATSLPSQD
jgi:hypothetical protein